MNNKKDSIYIEQIDYSKIKEVLTEWIRLYIEELDTELTFKLHNINEGKTVIELNKEIQNKLFNFLINFLQSVEETDHKAIVYGFTKVRDNNIYPKEQINQRIQVFVPKETEKFDAVFSVTEFGTAYEIDFDGRTKEINSKIKYHKPSLEYKNSNIELIDVNKKAILKKQDDVALSKFNSRFKIISPLFIIGVFCAGYFTYQKENFEIVVQIASFGLCFWAMAEHKNLRFNSVSIKLFSLSVLLTISAHFLIIELGNDYWLGTAKMSLCFLFLYTILRYIYTLIFKREPILDKSAELLADKIYTITLLIGTFITSFYF